MSRLYGILGWGIVVLGVVHMAFTPRTLTISALWFFCGGIALVQTGGLNLLNRAYGRKSPGLRGFCIGTNAVMTAFAIVAGRVGHAPIGELLIIGGWMLAATVVSFRASVL